VVNDDDDDDDADVESRKCSTMIQCSLLDKERERKRDERKCLSSLSLALFFRFASTK
jgi:hypothetical protein